MATMKCEPAEWECLEGLELQIILPATFPLGATGGLQQSTMSSRKKGNLYFDGRVYFDAYLRKRIYAANAMQWIWILPLSYSLRVIDDGGEALLLLLLPIVEEPSLSLYSSLLLDDFLDNRKWNLKVTHSWYFLFNFLFTDVAIIRARKACDMQLLEQAEAWLIIFCLLPVCDRGKDTHRVGLQQEGKYARWRTILTSSSSSIHGIVVRWCMIWWYSKLGFGMVTMWYG